MKKYVRLNTIQASGLSVGVGVLALLAGVLLVVTSSNSNDGSPVGWFLVACGAIGVLTAVAIFAGAYRE
jgi:uncharacterized membrane protein HdeD (DUF308 family)